MTIATSFLLGCQAIQPAAVLPERNSVVRDQLVLLSDFTLPPQHRLLDELSLLRGDLSQKLSLAATEEPIYVYLFRTPEKYNDYIHRYYPGVADRRAFFVETDTRLAVYALWGDRVAEDLRHEVAHGYLHAALSNLPLWIDEGLAEYFEVPRGQRGLNVPHVELLARQIRQADWRPNMARLELLGSAGAMKQLDYAESWAWMHWLLETDEPRYQLLAQYLQALKRDGTALPPRIPLRELEPAMDDALSQHILALYQAQQQANAIERPSFETPF